MKTKIVLCRRLHYNLNSFGKYCKCKKNNGNCLELKDLLYCLPHTLEMKGICAEKVCQNCISTKVAQLFFFTTTEGVLPWPVITIKILKIQEFWNSFMLCALLFHKRLLIIVFLVQIKTELKVIERSRISRKKRNASSLQFSLDKQFKDKFSSY